MTLEDCTQPFWVGHNNPHFPTARNGYLPALESQEVMPKDILEPRFKDRQWDIVNQLRLNQINLRNTLYKTLKEIKAKNASNRKTVDMSKLNNIYKGRGGEDI